MPLLRGLAALLTLGLLGLTPVALAGPAPVGDSVVSSRTTDAATTARAKPRRDLNDRSVKRGNTWYIKGKITPDGGRKTVIFKRKLAKKAPWKVYRKVKADGKGRYSVRVEFPRSSSPTWYYKGYVKAGKKFAASPTDRIYTACRRIAC